MRRGKKCENLCRKANLHIPAVCSVCGVPVWHGVFEEYPGAWRGVADADCNCPGRTLAGGYIKVCIDRENGNMRRILVLESSVKNQYLLTKNARGIDKNRKAPIDENVKQNNTSNNTKKEYIAQSALGINTPQDFHFSQEMENAINQWLAYKAERRQTYKGKGLQMLLAQIKKKIAQYNEQTVINLMEESMANNWQGIAWGKLEKAKPQMLRPEDIEL